MQSLFLGVISTLDQGARLGAPSPENYFFFAKNYDQTKSIIFFVMARISS